LFALFVLLVLLVLSLSKHAFETALRQEGKTWETVMK
jgi:hypothetical protein